MRLDHMINEPDDVPARLLAAAAILFAEHGYDAVTTRQIATAAGVTLACINYHFDGKAGLYRETLLTAHRQAMSQMRPDGVDAESRLRAYIRALLATILDPQQIGVRLLARELASPTGALRDVVERSIRPSAENLRTIVRELLGGNADEELVRHAAISVIGQCLHWHHGRPVIAMLYPGEPFDAGRIADHIADLTIGGLRGLAARSATPRSQP